jgi:hypothetical protein
MEISAVLETYKPENMGAFMVGSAFFFLYGIQTLIDINVYIQELNITDLSTVNRATLVYSYMAGYFVFIIRLLIALMTIFLLILIVRIIIATVISMFGHGGGQQGGAALKGGAQAIMAGAAMESSNVVSTAVKTNMKWILGFITSPIFFVMFLIVIPCFLFLFLLVYIFFFDKNVVSTEPEKATRIMLTHHFYLMFIITSLFVMCFFYCIYFWFKLAFRKEGGMA